MPIRIIDTSALAKPATYGAAVVPDLNGSSAGRAFEAANPSGLARDAACSRMCVLIPTYTNASAEDQSHEQHVARLLDGIGSLARDRVPVFLIVDRDADVAVTQHRIGLHALGAANATILSMEGVLAVHGQGYSEAMATAYATPIRACREGIGQRSGLMRMGGHLKKLYGLRHLLKFGCELTWLLDDDSMPLRRFSFCELMRRGRGKVLVHDMKDATSFAYRQPEGGLACLAAAKGIHRLRLSPAVRRLDLRQNDFWLMENSLVATMMQHAVKGRPSDSFVDAYAAGPGGQVGEQIVWWSWIAERMVRGSLPQYALMTRGGVGLVDSCLRRLGTRLLPPQKGESHLSTFAAVARTPDDWRCIGRLLRLQGQPGMLTLTLTLILTLTLTLTLTHTLCSASKISRACEAA